MCIWCIRWNSILVGHYWGSALNHYSLCSTLARHKCQSLKTLFLITKHLSFGRVSHYRRLIHKVGSDTPILSSLVWESRPCFATISLVPDSEGHKPKHNSLYESFITEISLLGGYRRFIHKVGSDTPILSSLIWESWQILLPPALPLSHSCQTPKVINLSVMRTGVVLCNSINKPLSDGHVLSIMVHKQLVRICRGGGGMGLSPRPHVDLQVRGKIILFKLGYEPPKREIIVMEQQWTTLIGLFGN